MKRFVSMLMVAGGLSLVGAAAAASGSYVSGGYAGHTSQSSHGKKVTITFDVVKPAHGQAYVTNIAYATVDKCPHVTFTVHHTEAAHIPITAGGHFTDSHNYPKSSSKNHINLTGHLQGKSASGSVSDDNVSPPPACHATASWSAKHK